VPFPGLVKRDFTASAPNVTWVGDMTEIPTDEGKLYLSTAIDLFSRRLLGYATSRHPDAELACQTIKMAVAARGGKERVAGVIFHSDRGSTYTAHDFTTLCRKLDIRQSMGRTGSCFDCERPNRSSQLWNTRCSPVITSKPERSTADYCEMGRRLLQSTTSPQFLWHAIPDRLRDRSG
jgi:transposase InsO family protein